MTTTEARSGTTIETPKAASVDMKLEIVVIPVSDVDRAKRFYCDLGWRLDADFADGDDFRVIQFTPPGSPASVIFGKNVTAAAPGSAQGLYLIVTDIEGARQEPAASRRRDQRGVSRWRQRVRRHGRALFIRTGPRGRSGSRPRQLPLLCIVQRSGRQWLAVPGGHHAIAGPDRLERHQLRLRRGSEKRDVAGGGRPWRA